MRSSKNEGRERAVYTVHEVVCASPRADLRNRQLRQHMVTTPTNAQESSPQFLSPEVLSDIVSQRVTAICALLRIARNSTSAAFSIKCVSPHLLGPGIAHDRMPKKPTKLLVPGVVLPTRLRGNIRHYRM